MFGLQKLDNLILKMVCEDGLSVREIAQQLNRKPRTIKWHLAKCYRRVGIPVVNHRGQDATRKLIIAYWKKRHQTDEEDTLP